MKIKRLFRGGFVGLLSLSLASAAPGGGDDAALARYAGGGAVSAQSLRSAIEPLFEEDGTESMGETRALLVLHDGEVVAERYAPGFGPDSKLMSWSIAKTVTAVLIGIMVQDGRLALDDPLPLPQWRQHGDPRGAITLRQMLQMTSGIAHREKEGPPEDSDALRMLVGDGAGDMAAYAVAKPLASRPGETFRYSSANSLILSDMMTRMLTGSEEPRERRDAMMRFVRNRLIEQTGMASLTPEFDARGTMIGGAIMHMTARDYARLGELLRNSGRVNGRQIVSENWVRFMTRPSAANSGYGGHVWLNRPGAEHILFVGKAPESLYAASGLLGQYVIVSPRQRLTIVRLGVTSDAQMPVLRDALARVIDRFPVR